MSRDAFVFGASNADHGLWVGRAPRQQVDLAQYPVIQVDVARHDRGAFGSTDPSR